MIDSLLAPVQWARVGIVIGLFAGIAALLALLIALVAKLCKTDAEDRLEEVLKHLAGANCGGCGCSGCSAFAKKLCNGEAILNDCRITESEGKQKIASLLNLSYEEAQPSVSVCRCRGGLHAKDKFEYSGALDCAAEDKLYGGRKACPYGCLGEGDCIRACPEEAIVLCDECAEVNPDKCTSCGACLKACPKNLFMRIPADAKVYVACASHDKGKAVLDVCKYGCIACAKCAKICPTDAILMVDNLPVISYEKCIKCGECAKVCPRNTIVLRY